MVPVPLVIKLRFLRFRFRFHNAGEPETNEFLLIPYPTISDRRRTNIEPVEGLAKQTRETKLFSDNFPPSANVRATSARNVRLNKEKLFFSYSKV